MALSRVDFDALTEAQKRDRLLDTMYYNIVDGENASELYQNSSGTVTLRNGDVVDNLRKRLEDIGFDTPVAFASGLSITSTKTAVTYNGGTYYPNPSSLPFTTTGTFDTNQWVLILSSDLTTRVETLEGQTLDTRLTTAESEIDTLQATAGSETPKGAWAPSGGSFPGGGTSSVGDYWTATDSGTIDGVSFIANDQIVSLVANASTSTYSANWFKRATSQVTSVAGRTGDVTLAISDVASLQTNLDAKAALNGATATGTWDMTGATVTVATQSAEDDSTKVATTAYVDSAVSSSSASSDYLPSPDYSNTGGQGDRTASIVVTIDDTLITSGTPSNLVDGASGSNTTDSITYAASDATGLVVARFDYGIGKRKIITEATWTQSATSTHATVKWQASNDLLNWTDIGSSFTLGGATSQVQTELSTNRSGYRAYQLIGVSGSMSGSPYVHEVTFKIDNDFADDVVPGLATAFHDREGATPSFTNDMVAAYLPSMDKDGTTCYDRWGSYDIDLSSPSSQNYTRTVNGIKLESGLFETPEIPGVRQVCVFYRSKMDESSGFIISGGSSSGSGILEGSIPTSETALVSGFGHGWKTVTARSDNGAGAKETNRGVWSFLSRDMGASHDTILGIGGRHSTTTSRCAEIEIVAVFVFNATLTTAKRDELLLFMRQYAAGLGIYFINGDGPKEAINVSLIGDSQADGRALVAGWPSPRADSYYHHAPFLQIMSGGAGDDHQRWAPLVPLINTKIDSVITNGGIEQSYGFESALAKHIAENLEDFPRPVFCDKFGVGGSDLSSSSTGSATNGQDSWSPDELETSSLFYEWLAHHRRAMGLLMAEGYTVTKWVTVVYLGTNDMTSTDSAADATAAEALVDDLLDEIISECPSITPEFVWMQPASELSSEPGYDSTAVTRIRAGITNAGTARSDLTVEDTSGDTDNGDGTHFDGPAYITHATVVANIINS